MINIKEDKNLSILRYRVIIKKSDKVINRKRDRVINRKRDRVINRKRDRVPIEREIK